MLMKGDMYYDLLTCQKIHDLTNDLNLIELSLCYQNRHVLDLEQKLAKAYEIQTNLRSSHENLDRELAKLDGRHVQCENPECLLREKRRKKQKEKSNDLTKLLTKKQKQELLKALGAI